MIKNFFQCFRLKTSFVKKMSCPPDRISNLFPRNAFPLMDDHVRKMLQMGLQSMNCLVMQKVEANKALNEQSLPNAMMVHFDANEKKFFATSRGSESEELYPICSEKNNPPCTFAFNQNSMLGFDPSTIAKQRNKQLYYPNFYSKSFSQKKALILDFDNTITQEHLWYLMDCLVPPIANETKESREKRIIERIENRDKPFVLHSLFTKEHLEQLSKLRDLFIAQEKNLSVFIVSKNYKNVIQQIINQIGWPAANNTGKVAKIQVYGLSNKPEIINQILNKENINPKNALFVDDDNNERRLVKGKIKDIVVYDGNFTNGLRAQDFDYITKWIQSSSA